MPAAGRTTASVAPAATAATPHSVYATPPQSERSREEPAQQIREAHQATALDRGGVRHELGRGRDVGEVPAEPEQEEPSQTNGGHAVRLRLSHPAA